MTRRHDKRKDVLSSNTKLAKVVAKYHIVPGWAAGGQASCAYAKIHSHKSRSKRHVVQAREHQKENQANDTTGKNNTHLVKPNEKTYFSGRKMPHSEMCG